MKSRIDVLLDELQARIEALSDEERVAFAEVLGRAAARAGVSTDEATRTLLDLARGLNPFLPPGVCRDWSGRAWFAPEGYPRADERCELEVTSVLHFEDLDLGTVPCGNWRELALRSAARSPASAVDPEAPHFGERFCAGALKGERAAPF